MNDEVKKDAIKVAREAAAKRALAEAKERELARVTVNRPPEIGGRVGPEPTRFGDWEKKGIVSDF